MIIIGGKLKGLKNSQVSRKISLGNDKSAKNFYNNQTSIIEYTEEEFGVRLITRGNKIHIIGEQSDVESASKFLKKTIKELRRDPDIYLKLKKKKEPEQEIEIDNEFLLTTFRGKKIKPKTENQKNYVSAIKNYDMVFAIGPAGTGKTYLAVAMAVLALKEQSVSRVILTRPAVEAGEKLGFLPGDIQAKVDPYFRPLYDALFDMMNIEKFQKYLERGIIEIAPLAFMRGRTLNDAFIILDEAQNTTSEQMKMFLTRLGFSSCAVITGDITQIDLPDGITSGLTEVQDILKDIGGIKFVYFSDKDVVRHELVQKVILAYEKYERKT